MGEPQQMISCSSTQPQTSSTVTTSPQTWHASVSPADDFLVAGFFAVALAGAFLTAAAFFTAMLPYLRLRISDTRPMIQIYYTYAMQSMGWSVTYTEED